jgi:hypothetical protein
MGLTAAEYVSMGFHRPAGNAPTTPPANPAGPLTDRQKAFLNDLGVLPDAYPSTYGDASKLIALRQPDFAAFKDAHPGEKPATGRQRAALLRKDTCLSEVMSMTKTAAAAALDQDGTASEPTGPQVDLLRKLGETSTPSTAALASDLIRSLLATRSKPTAKQLALIVKLQPQMSQESLDRLTQAQACALIAALLARINNKKKGAKRSRPEDPSTDDSHDAAGEPNQPAAQLSSGAYG